MANLFSALSAEAAPAGTSPAEGRDLLANERLLVAGTDPALLDFVAFVARTSRREVTVLAPADLCRRVASPAHALEAETVSPAVLSAAGHTCQVAGVVFFLGRCQRRSDRVVLEVLAELIRTARPASICVVGSFLVHLGDSG